MRCNTRLGLGVAEIILILFALETISPGGDWPQFRGPTADGIAAEERLADSWPENGPPVLWTRELGQGYSAFTVSQGRAYTQTQSLYDQTLVCLDAETGETIWSYRYGWPYDGGGLYPGPRSTPAVADGCVYFAAPNGLIGCVSAKTGTLIWSTNPKTEFRGRGTDFGVSASPVVWRDRLILPVGGVEASLVALEAKTGRLLWQCGELPASYATPVVVPFQDRHLVIAPLENSLLCADAETGERLWELDLSAGYDEHSAAVLYREPLLMLAGPFRSGAHCYRLVGDADTSAIHSEPLWDAPKFSNDIASSVLVDGDIYGFDLKDAQSRLHRPSSGEFRCLDWETGKIRWSSPEPGHANVIAADDKLLLFNDRGELKLARQSREQYIELASTSVFPDEICWTPPALSNGRVYLRTQTRAACLYLGKEPVGFRADAGSVADIPRATRIDPTMFVGGEREFPAATPEWDELWVWYRWTVTAIAVIWLGTGAMTGGVLLLIRQMHSGFRQRSWGDDFQGSSRWLGLCGIAVCGALGSAFLNPHREEFLWTWPLALWALMQGATEASLTAVLPPASRIAGWRARGMIALFLAGCGLYFHLCRKLGLATEWSFLTGFVAACPLALFVDAGLRRFPYWRWWASLPVLCLSYSVYFWASVLFMKWRLRVGS